MRYGLQLCGKVRWAKEDPVNQQIVNLHKCQNKLMQIINGVQTKDRISTKIELEKTNGLSGNQINATVLLDFVRGFVL